MLNRNRAQKLLQIIIEYIQKNILMIVGIFGGVVVIVISMTIPLLQSPILKVSFLDVGQGDAIFIQASNGKKLLIDAGPDQSVVEEVGKILPFFDRRIDMVLATHSDADHIGGFPYLFDRYYIPLVIESEIASPTVVHRIFGEKKVAEQSNRLVARAGERIILDPKNNIVIDIIFPDQNPVQWETNEASIIVKVSYGETSFLLTGDAPSEVENHLIDIYGEQLQSNVLKLGHHGSKTSTSDLLLEVVKPEFAIVSAGLGNRYGHPHPEVVERVELNNAHILETATVGTIYCMSNGIRVVCSNE